MVRIVIGLLAVLGLSGAACGVSTIRTYEGQTCSTDMDDDDPRYTCSPAQDLICISTKTVKVTEPTLAAKYPNAQRPVYLCRYACNVDNDCRDPNSICCPGTLYGKTY